MKEEEAWATAGIERRRRRHGLPPLGGGGGAGCHRFGGGCASGRRAQAVVGWSIRRENKRKVN